MYLASRENVNLNECIYAYFVNKKKKKERITEYIHTQRKIKRVYNCMENLIVSYFNIHESRMFRKEQSGINIPISNSRDTKKIEQVLFV